MAERKQKVAKRPKARREAAAAESGKRVKLEKNFQNEMSPADRIRYYLGLPQGYPMNPVLIEKARVRLKREKDARGSLTPFESQVNNDVISAFYAETQDDRFEGYPGVADQMRTHAKDILFSVASDTADPMQAANKAMQSLYGTLPNEYPLHYGPDVFPSQEAAAAHLRRSGFRDPGESLEQARARARQEAAQPQNPRMGGPKRKHGGY